MVVVDDEAIELGSIKIGGSKQVKLPQRDNFRVIFTLEQEREGWLGTNVMLCDTLIINDDIEVFDIEYLQIEE
jgi:hypothetical protein